MCGIAGFATTHGAWSADDRALLTSMTSVIAHRGPDDVGIHLDAGVGLGHRRLSIIDVAHGHQPLFAGDVTLVFNGEIYNHVELRAELEARGARPTTNSDGEVILHGYREWGWRGMLERLRGMFAIALHDRTDGALYLARDPFGIKPLFVAETERGLLFGSELKAIVAALPSRPPIDRRGLLECATLGFTMSPTTIFEGVESMPAGTALTWRDGRVTRERHFALEYDPTRSPDDPDALWEQVTRAVDSHLMSEVPLGAFLSGGVDSSAVVSAMSQVKGGDVDAVCVGILEPGMDERPYAREVAQGLGVTLHEEEAAPDLLDLLPRLAWHVEQPFGDTSIAPTYLVCEAARRHVTVALSGDGGDENFAGYRRTRYDVLEDGWRNMIPSFLRRGVVGPLGRAWPRGAWLPRPLRAGTLLTNLGGDWLDAYIRSMSRIDEASARAWLRPDAVDATPLRERFEPHAQRTTGLSSLSRILSMDVATWLADDILVKADRASMAHALEVRVPLLDTDFVSWAAGLPDDAKLSGGEGKALFKRSLRGRVPDAVLDRRKQGFHLPVDRWLATTLRDRLEGVLDDRSSGTFDLVDPAPFRTMLDDHAAGRVDRSTELWFLLMLDAFLRHGPGAPDAPVAAASPPAEVAP